MLFHLILYQMLIFLYMNRSFFKMGDFFWQFSFVKIQNSERSRVVFLHDNILFLVSSLERFSEGLELLNETELEVEAIV